MLNLNKLYICFRLRLYPSWPLSFLVQNLIFVSTWKLRFNILTGNSNFYIHLSSPMFPIYLLQNPSSTTALTDDSLIICNKRNFCLHEADIYFWRELRDILLSFYCNSQICSSKTNSEKSSSPTILLISFPLIAWLRDRLSEKSTNLHKQRDRSISSQSMSRPALMGTSVAS